MSNSKKITVKNLSYSAGSVSILEDISFDIGYGTFTAIIGPNGAGKSTLVKAMLGLIKPSAGSVSYDGITVDEVNSKHRTLGYVPQNFSVDRTFPITLDEFFRTTCIIKDEARYDSILDTLNIMRVKKNILGGLSGGEMQRALIAFNLLHDHDVIFLDEPTSAIDTEGEAIIYSILKDINEKFEKTIIIVSHDIDTVLKNVDIVICLNKTLHCIGCTHEIVSGGMLNDLFESRKGLYRHRGCNHNHA